MYERGERFINGFGGGHLRKRDHLEGSAVDERIILKWIFRKWNKSMDWIDLAQNRDTWRALVNTVLNFRIS